MNADHWFDQLNRSLVQRLPRRGVLTAIGLLLAGIAGGTTGAAAPKRKRKRRRKRRPTGKPKRTCSRGVCNREWRPKQERRSCEATCRRCKRTGSQFCIQKSDTVKIADCCDQGEPCCNNKCCPHWESADGPVPSQCCESGECCPRTWDCCGLLCCPPGECCDAGNVKFCRPAGTICCPDEAETRLCQETEYCCTGVGCVANQRECACATGGECPDDDCADGRPRCNGQCCPTGSDCVNGSCQCPICNDWRGTRCCPPGERCFGQGQDQACCPSGYIDPPCPFHQDGLLCYPDVPWVCCDGHAHARNPPEDYLCYGRVPTGGVSPGTDCGDHPYCYPPLSIYRPS